MAHQARRLAKIFALGFLTLSAGVALLSCGGSASETPPPLEPHPANLHYSRSSTALSAADLPAESDAGTSEPSEAPPAAFEPPPPSNGAPAPRTWGADPARKSAPALK
jgi:hypothetical protein